jgi:hypothetical protein
MSVQCDSEYDRERLALYVTGLLPIDPDEGQAVLDLCGRLLPLLVASKGEHPQPCEVQRERGEPG